MHEALAERTKRLMERRTLLLYSDKGQCFSTSDEDWVIPKDGYIYWSKFQARAHMHTCTHHL